MKRGTVRSLSPRREESAAPRLGRGVVTAVHGARVTLALTDGAVVEAELALPLPYAACEGDVLLVLGDGVEHFVVGVLSGRGKTSLAIEGDVSLRAVGGVLDLAGDAGVRLSAPSLEVRADKLTTVARSVVQSFASLFQRVTEVLHVHAKEEVAIVEEGSYRQARTAAIQTEETITVNGKEIHLG
jgi:hypothetical protein